MIIIIDGYNMIRQSDVLRSHERKSLEEGRRALIAILSEYEKKKNHKITVVFDGGKSDWADWGRDIEEKINIIYSRYGEKADDVIKRMVDHIAEDTIVVSSDREISSYASQLGITSLASPEFEKIINKVIYESPEKSTAANEKNIGQPSKKKGPAKRLPRARRNMQSKISKLG